MRFLLLMLAFVAALTTLASAQETSALRTLMTGNDSRGWEAVGRLNIAGQAFCTGALIAPDLVLTAAHCLFDGRTGRRVQTEDIEFLAGWRNGRANAHARLRNAIPHPDFVFDGPDRDDRIANDLALLQLDRPIRKSSVTPFATDTRPRKGDEVGVVSYARGRTESPSLQEVCHVLARQSGTLVLSCDVDFGSSGAPVFTVSADGEARIVSVISAKADVRGRQVALGTSLKKPLAELMAMMPKPGAVPATGATVRTLSSGRTPKGAGAKFVRP